MLTLIVFLLVAGVVYSTYRLPTLALYFMTAFSVLISTVLTAFFFELNLQSGTVSIGWKNYVGVLLIVVATFVVDIVWPIINSH